MHYRLYVRWEKLTKEPLNAEGVVEVHVFENYKDFSSSWLEKYEFAVGVRRHARFYWGINDKHIPKLPKGVMERLNIMVDSYFKGFVGDNNAYCWHQESYDVDGNVLTMPLSA